MASFKAINMDGNVLVIVDKPANISGWETWKLYSATTEEGEYSVINGTTGKSITDLTYFDTDGDSTTWYKVSYWKEGPVESSATAVKQASSNIYKYTTVEKVEDFLQSQDSITDSTPLNWKNVFDKIIRAEDNIDQDTMHAWRTRFSETEHGSDTTAQYEYHDIDFNYERQSGRPVYLGHRQIKSFDADEGDVFEVFDGSGWINFLTEKEEGRDNDWWLVPKTGIIYIKQRFAIVKPLSARFKYRYGENSVRSTVEGIATRMVAVEILASEPNSVILPEGGNASMTFDNRISRWNAYIKKNLADLREYPVPRLGWV